MNTLAKSPRAWKNPASSSTLFRRMGLSASVLFHLSKQICETPTADGRLLGGGIDSPAPQRKTTSLVSIAVRSLVFSPGLKGILVLGIKLQESNSGLARVHDLSIYCEQSLFMLEDISGLCS